MRIPDSFRQAFLPETTLGKQLEKTAGGQLRRLCKQNGWLFADRVKDEESALAKCQQGGLAALSDLDDLYGATVVVPTRDQLETAIDAIRSQYHDAEVTSSAPEATKRAATTFRYDDIHLRASLGSTAPGLKEAIKNRGFEIQVRTGLQFAWWRAQHDQVYKGEASSWRLERTANQVRGSIELLDGVLANLPAAASLLDERESQADAEFDRIAAWLAQWPPDRRPNDTRRFVVTVRKWLSQAGFEVSGLEVKLNGPRGKELVATEQVTPAQAVQALAAESCGADRLASGSLRLLLTDELARASEELARIEPSQRVALL